MVQKPAKPWGSISGHVYDGECEWLSREAAGLRVLEIGTHHGRSTSALASTAESVVTVDTYQGDAQIGPPSLEVTTENLSPFTNIRIVVGDWRDVGTNPFEYDLIWYDGCHTEEGEFLATLAGYHGIVALHDYKPGETGMRHVIEAVDKFAAESGRPKLFGAGSIVWFDAIDPRNQS
jgi:protein-L-isoaspartate O-methyltransferase